MREQENSDRTRENSREREIEKVRARDKRRGREESFYCFLPIINICLNRISVCFFSYILHTNFGFIFIIIREINVKQNKYKTVEQENKN